jgi:hypothetical protein
MEAAALRELLTFLPVPLDADTERDVQRLVCDFVDDRKAAGWPPERIIVAVKQIALEAGLRPSTTVIKRDATLTTVDNFLVEMVGWCIHRYFHQE